jgi:AcrR family transcriptional regulator
LDSYNPRDAQRDPFALAFSENTWYVACMSKQHTTSEHSEGLQETRARIITAAAKVLAEKGYEATTLREISREAEAAPGLVHYYFGGKDQLLVEVLKALSDRHTQTTEVLSRSVAPEQFMEAALEQPVARITEQPEWYRLRYELFVLGLHNPLLAPSVRDLLAEGRTSIGKAISLMQQSSSIAQSVDPAVLASLLLAVFDGLALQKIMDPAVDLNAAYQLLAQMIRRLPSDKE